MTGESLLVLLRHGASAANEADRFAGWIDEPLSVRGAVEAEAAGRLIAAADARPAVVHSSVLSRATATAELALEAWGDAAALVRSSWRLNERYYGAWQGRSRREVLVECGSESFREVRRSYGARPPGGESLADVVERVAPVWAGIRSDLAAGPVLVVSHGNTLRALVSLIEGMPTHRVGMVEIPTGDPLLYRLPRSLVPGAAPLFLKRGARADWWPPGD